MRQLKAFTKAALFIRVRGSGKAKHYLAPSQGPLEALRGALKCSLPSCMSYSVLRHARSPAMLLQAAQASAVQARGSTRWRDRRGNNADFASNKPSGGSLGTEVFQGLMKS